MRISHLGLGLEDREGAGSQIQRLGGRTQLKETQLWVVGKQIFKEALRPVRQIAHLVAIGVKAHIIAPEVAMPVL